ncbi:uncharacterized protein GGS22DRAFT_23450 [Annulohypoxylon maeteangense]|uniref:uncharacterized protein n=1 Tax=Annulohypoxylon maeteangense TaxID=1927788 RepID=UPI002007C85F|nr:uncharacterized protein GGS22DRAFT_23450 [Annulohypoxylon maeteangense]KAI0884466.1 hypothetical protein GGS22DRAFT_23450 [Annulohypoxylon maeteangense]
MAQQQDPNQGWPRWLPQHSNSDYQMVDTGLIQYTPTPTTTAAVHRNIMPTQFIADNTYHAIAPIHSPQAPQYSPSGQFMFSQYPPTSPSPIASSFKQYQDECSPSRAIVANTDIEYRKEPYQTHSLEQDARPTIKYEPQVAILRSPTPDPITVKTITRNVAENEANEIIFNTEVDTLMKAIQSKDQPDKVPDFGAAAYPSPPHMDEEKFNLRRKSCTPDEKNHATAPSGKERQRKYVCDIKGCGKRCSQKTQLETHKRAHTGEKPFICEEEGCGQRFTQRGNLKTHSRRHTGEKPYQCDICGQRFAQLGNVKPHKLTHFNTKPFRCIFYNCQKTFGQRGNLKTHHNKFHKDDIKELTMKFKSLAPGAELPEEDRKLFHHFAELYKNSNKGIKGRGSNRSVASKYASARNHGSLTPSGPHQYPAQSSLLSHQIYRLLPQHGLPCPDNYGNINMSRHNSQGSIVIPRDPHASYGSYDMDQSSIASSETTDNSTASSSPNTVYEEYGRTFTAPHRMY